MRSKLLPVGTPILAVKNVGPVQDGQPGVVTGVVDTDFLLWKRPMYLCTFLGNVRVAMKPNEISDSNHGRTIEELEMPEDGSLSVAEQLKRIRPLKQ